MEEIDLVRNNTAALFGGFNNSLLGEDLTIPTMSFDLDGMYCVLCTYRIILIKSNPSSLSRVKQIKQCIGK